MSVSLIRVVLTCPECEGTTSTYVSSDLILGDDETARETLDKISAAHTCTKEES